MILPGTAAIPAVHADRLRAAEATGRAAMQLARTGLTPDRIVTPDAVENALRALMAIGGSTNAVLHLTAIAGRAGIDIDLNRLNRDQRRDPGFGRSEADRPALHGRSVRSWRHRRGAARVAAAVASRLPDGDRRNLGRASCRTRRPGRSRRCQAAWRPVAARGRAHGAVRFAGAGRSDLQALGRRSEIVREGGESGRLHLARGFVGAHRRSRARRDSGRFPGAAKRRAALGLGHAGSRLSTDPARSSRGPGSRTWCAFPTRE